jgi:hypothetical protein
MIKNPDHLSRGLIVPLLSRRIAVTLRIFNS